MQSDHQLDSYIKSYTSEFPHFSENLMVHAAYGNRIASHIKARSIQSSLSLGIGHAEVVNRILGQLVNGTSLTAKEG